MISCSFCREISKQLKVCSLSLSVPSTVLTNMRLHSTRWCGEARSSTPEDRKLDRLMNWQTKSEPFLSYSCSNYSRKLTLCSHSTSVVSLVYVLSQTRRSERNAFTDSFSFRHSSTCDEHFPTIARTRVPSSLHLVPCTYLTQFETHVPTAVLRTPHTSGASEIAGPRPDFVTSQSNLSCRSPNHG